MQRLIEGLGQNSPAEYDRIFKERQKKGVDEFDLRRWKMLLKYYRGGNLIDLGCLDSMIPEMIEDQSKYWGIDIASLVIDYLAKKYPYSHISLGNLYQTEFPDNFFDYAVMGEILEHLEYPAKAVWEVIRILKPNGILAISIPKEEVLEKGAVDKERHLWSLNLDDIKAFCHSTGGKVIEYKILGSKWFPYYKYHFPNLIVYIQKIDKNKKHICWLCKNLFGITRYFSDYV